MSDKFYSYKDKEGDDINIKQAMHGNTYISLTSEDVVIPQEELPNLIAVLQSHLEEPTDDRPWFIVKANSDLVGPFSSEQDAREHKTYSGDLVRQVMPPEPDIDHEWAGNWARSLTKDTESVQDQNLARAYLELSAKQ